MKNLWRNIFADWTIDARQWSPKYLAPSATSLNESRDTYACSATINAGPVALSLAFVYRYVYRHVYIHQGQDQPASDGNSRIIPISSGDFVAQFVSRKEYDITGYNGGSSCNPFIRLVNHVNWIFILHFWTTILFPVLVKRGCQENIQGEIFKWNG